MQMASSSSPVPPLAPTAPTISPPLLMSTAPGCAKNLPCAVAGCAPKNVGFSRARSCSVRLATQEEGVKLSNEQKLAALKTILDTPLAAPEKSLVLSGLGAITNREALSLAVKMLDDSAVKAEAALASTSAVSIPHRTTSRVQVAAC